MALRRGAPLVQSGFSTDAAEAEKANGEMNGSEKAASCFWPMGARWPKAEAEWVTREK
jgi:hypothetical protein